MHKNVFIKKTGLSMERVKVGLIGAGRIGQVHAQTLSNCIPEAQLAVVCDIDLEAAQKCARHFKIPEYTQNREVILQDKSIDAVVIASSTNTHIPIIHECAKAGKHIFCEKPVSIDLAQLDGTLKVVRESQVKLQIGFNRRFDANFKHIRNLITADEIGKIHLLRITSRDPAPPSLDYIKISGGMFLDMTIHDFDMASYLIGSEVTQVYAHGQALIDPAIREVGDIDTAVITLQFAEGAIGVIDNSRQAVYGYDQRVEVFGTKGTAHAKNKTPHDVILSNQAGTMSALPLHFFLERYMESYIEEIKAFVQAILDDGTPPVTGSDIRNAIAVGLAAKKSHLENRPVSLIEIEKDLKSH